MLKVREINQLTELSTLRETWSRLLKATPRFSFFQTFEWLEAAWGHYPQQRLRAVIVERDGDVVGIVPFCVRTERRRIGAVRVLTYPLDDWSTFYGPISAEPTVVMKASLKHIEATPHDWDVIDLRYVDQAAAEYMTIGEAFRETGNRFFIRPRMEVRFCRMDDGWNQYVESRSRNWRRQMRRDIEVLEKAGPVEMLRYRPEAGGTGRDARTLEIYAICEQIAAKSWQAEAESQSTLSSPRVRDLLLEFHCRAAALGMLDTNILTVAGRPVAFNYNYVAEGRTYGLRAGFDPSAEMEHCGRILLYKMLEDSFARGDAEYSFGPGRQAYKDRFATELRCAYTFRSYSTATIKSRVMQWRERVVSSLYSEQELAEKSLVD
ncbi:GNAT family N-acetyltransferase [Lacipirellula limnantheis]|uniref:BioF2-like acetyltransferase domain-containing protein n=1 Tax=Lacipirellula limnantheis TaxID=2528024 RepID=A0A517TVB5_9BACT|nr:GNAT family N-acetyltransferase [Lacipirellula limnantheis]QDT72298.1 hypothetical protein I41_14700 [Lacipirellula limnantheis]